MVFPSQQGEETSGYVVDVVDVVVVVDVVDVFFILLMLLMLLLLLLLSCGISVTTGRGDIR